MDSYKRLVYTIVLYVYINLLHPTKLIYYYGIRQRPTMGMTPAMFLPWNSNIFIFIVSYVFKTLTNKQKRKWQKNFFPAISSLKKTGGLFSEPKLCAFPFWGHLIQYLISLILPNLIHNTHRRSHNTCICQCNIGQNQLMIW